MGPDGVRRLVAYSPLLGQATDGPVVVVAIPLAIALAAADRLLLTGLVGLGVVGLLVFGATWLASDVLVLRRVTRLLTATRRFGAGELGARVGSNESGELGLLARAFDEMAESVERVTQQNRRILESTGDGIYGLDRRGRVTFVNPAAERMCGYAAAELLGQPMHALIHHSRADGSPFPPEQCPSAQTLREGATRQVYDDLFWHKNGTSFPVDYVSAPIVRDGHVEGVVVAFRDVTERRRAEEQMHRQREILQQTEKVATMGSLLAGVAHELNNPLAVVLGQVMLLREGATEPALVRRADKIKTAAERCARIVKNFLALARQHPPERGAVDLNQVVQEAAELLGYELRTSGVEMQFRLADTLPILHADGHQLHQVVVNLIANAQQAMRQTPPPRRITITTAHDAGALRVRLAIADTGPGIPAEVRAKIFEPFFTTKPPGEGTGLGLSLCRGIAEEHGGTLGVDSEPGRGAEFVLELPATVAADAVPPAAERPARVSPSAILVVDDEPEIAATLAEVLERDGHTVDIAGDGAEGLDRLRARAYDVIFTDTRMPGLDGVAFYEELARRLPALARRVIFVTGDLIDRDKREFLESTGRPVVPKPFDLDSVRRALGRVLTATA
jgi:two-component system NtrC family sensor kinase